MKALHELDNAGKARLLYDLFPQEIPALIENLENVCRDLTERKEYYANNWDNGFMPFDYWLSLSCETAVILNRHKYNMLKSSRVFSDQLFFTYTSIFVNDRIIKYAEHQSHNERFKLAVNMLYGLYP